MTINETGKEPFVELNYILDCLKSHNLDPALAWVTNHRETLEMQNSSLEFKLHRLHFISLIQKGECSQMEAINYARQHFYKFVHRHEKGEQTILKNYYNVNNN